jgi:hypothetical protein
MATIPAQVISQVIINNIVPLITTSASYIASSYFTSSRETIIKTVQDVNEEYELDLLQMDRMLKWMKLVFEATPSTTETETDDLTPSKYKQELYSIYMTICSDHKEYQRWKMHNASLWMFSNYRKKNTKQLAKKILADIKLFNEGLKLFSMMKNVTI